MFPGNFGLGSAASSEISVYELTFRTRSLKAHLLEMVFAVVDLQADSRLRFGALDPTLSLKPL